VFNWAHERISVQEGVAEVRVAQGQNPLENVRVHLFASSGTYLGVYGQTDQEGVVSFRLPEGSYRFRADYQGTQYWASGGVEAHQRTEVNLNTGGGTFTLSVGKGDGTALESGKVYVFNGSGTYLGMGSRTDDQGEVSFHLSDGAYRFRVDYLGCQFWTDTYTVPGTLSDLFTIPHEEVTVTVEGLYQGLEEPLEGVKVYLFKESGSYMGVNEVTDAGGQVSFFIPSESYKVRADYLGYQFWSEPFVWLDTDVSIPHGKALIHVSEGGGDVIDAPVYLFTAAGAYMGRYERTDTEGEAAFLLPDQAYKFRVDHGGRQYWSDVTHIIADEENKVELNLDQLALCPTRNPVSERYDGEEPPQYRPEPIRLATAGSLVGILSHAVVANTQQPALYFYLNDHLGTPQLMVDEDNIVVWEAKYRPFGEAQVHPYSTVTNNFRFPGQYYDAETGLHYNYHRYYDPRTGRYLRPDPIGLEGGINPFVYAWNSPNNSVDPDGLKVFYWGIGGNVGFGRKKGETVNYFSTSGIVYQGSTREGGTEKGVAGSLGGGRIAGAVAGTGLIAGYHQGDVEDLSSRTTAAGITFGFISIELTFDKKNSWTGFNIGLFKSLGLGIYGVESHTNRFPTHVSDYETCE
jgi:RHS repeat-associated protein